MLLRAALQDLLNQSIQVGVQLVMMLVVSLVFALSLMGASISRLLGHTGINVLTRLFGMPLAALSVQFVIDGLRETGLAGAI